MPFQDFTGELDPTTYNDPRLDDYARKVAQQRGIDPEILLSIKNQGERSKPTAVSPKGATGVMQIMPQVWKAYGKGDPRDPFASIDAAANFIATELNPKYKGDRNAIVAHYNGGTSQGELVASGKQPTYAETQGYLARTSGLKGGFAPFTGTLDSDTSSNTQPTFQNFTGELDAPESPKQTFADFNGELDKPETPKPVAVPKQSATPAQSEQPWDGFGGAGSWLGSELKRAASNPAEFGKEVASSTGKLADLALSPISAGLGYLAAGTTYLASGGDSKKAKEAKDELQNALSIDQALQRMGVAKDTPEAATQVMDKVLGAPAKVIADTLTTPGTLSHDIATDASMFALAGGGLKGTKALADRSIKTPEVRPSAPDAVEPMRPQVQGELDLGAPVQEGPVQPGAGLVKNTETIPSIQGLVDQARYDLVKPDFQNAKEALGKFDEAVAKTNEDIATRPQTQYEMFDGELDQNQAYPNQTPRVPEVVPETVDPRVTEQQQLFTQPLHSLIQDAAASAEPKPYRELTPEESAQMRMDARIEAAREEPIDLPGRKQSQIPLDLDAPDQLSFQLDRAGEAIQGRGTQSTPGVSNLGMPTKEDFQTKKDLPMIMSPQRVVDIMGVDAKNLKAPPSELVRSVSPNWAKRDTWNNHPILRSTFDNLNHLRDERNAWLKELVDPRTDEKGNLVNPTKFLDSLSDMERREQAHYTIKYEGERTPAMVAEGRNFFNYNEWRERGASDRVAKALVEGSDIYQKALDKYNAEAKTWSERPIQVIPNYFPHRHYGDFFATITDKRNGQKEIFPFQTLKDARKAAEAMKGKIPSTHTIDYGRKQRGGNDFRDLMDALRTRSESFHGTNPNGFTTMLDSMRKSMDEAFFAGRESRSGKGHYTGEQGYDLGADKKTQKAQRDEVRFVTDSPRTYAQNMADYVMDRKVQALKEAYQKAAEQNGFSHTGAWQDTNRVINKQASLYTEPVFDSSKTTIIEDAVDSVAKLLDRNSAIEGHSPVSWLGRRALVARMHNMNRVASTLLLHPITNSALTISQFAQFMTSPLNVFGQISRAVGKNAPAEGFMGQLKQTGKTPTVIAEAFTRGVWDVLAPEKMRSESGKQALQWAKQHGHLDTMISHEHLDAAGKIKRLAKLEDVTIASEQIPRSMTFLAGYHSFRRLGFTDGAAKRAAVEFSNTVMGDYTKEGKIEFIRDQAPLIGTAISPFSTWLWNSKAQVAALTTNLGGHGKKSFISNVVTPLAALAGVTYMFTGWSGMPGVQDYDNIVKWLNETFNTENPTSAQLHMQHGEDVFGKEANAAYYGKIAEETGRDTGKSIRYGSIVDFGAPGASYATSLGKAGYQLGKKALSQTGLVEPPTDMDLYKSVKGATPPGLKTFTEDYFSTPRQDGNQTLKSGIVRKAGETEKSFWLAFNDLDEKKQQDVNNVANYIKARQNKLADRQLELIKDKALRGEDISGNFKTLVDLNPDYSKNPTSVVQSVIQEKIRRNLTQAEFEQLKAAQNTSLNDKQDAARRKQFLEKLVNAK